MRSLASGNFCFIIYCYKPLLKLKGVSNYGVSYLLRILQFGQHLGQTACHCFMWHQLGESEWLRTMEMTPLASPA